MRQLHVRDTGANAELTYSLDGRILGVELPSSGHGRGYRIKQTTGVLNVSRTITAVGGLLLAGPVAQTLTLTWTLRLRSGLERPPVACAYRANGVIGSPTPRHLHSLWGYCNKWIIRFLGRDEQIMAGHCYHTAVQFQCLLLLYLTLSCSTSPGIALWTHGKTHPECYKNRNGGTTARVTAQLVGCW